ncbi:hypothetical protein ACLKA6_008505 [Drosophila palustris]
MAMATQRILGASRPFLGRQELYPGTDFCRAFNIAPDVLGAPTTSGADPDVFEAPVANTDISYYRDEDDVVSDPEMWNLEVRQVTHGTLRTDPGRLEAIKNISNPRNTKELRSFLGTAGWYRRFIKNFAEISVPLTDALKKKEISINYTVTKKECLAPKLAIHRFRPYVEMIPFTVITDLQWLMSFKDLSGRLARWTMELQAFPFSMRYKKSADNVVADTLSRGVEELEVTPEDLLSFETLEFESADYQELV